MTEERVGRREAITGVLVAGAGLICPGLAGADPGRIEKRTAPERPWQWSTEALDYITGKDGDLQCRLCPNACRLSPGDRGICRVRVNIGGKLYSLVYGNPCTWHVDPIEKKPLNHFLPTTKAFSIATAGCNLRCLNCQNWDISQRRPEELDRVEMPPPNVVERAAGADCASIAYTYNEPTVFYEYMLSTAMLAAREKIRNVWVTNGYIMPGPLKRLCKVLDAANVDIKNFDEKIYYRLNGGRLKPVLETLKMLKENDVWFEITTLLVPTYSDDIDMLKRECDWILESLGPDYPLHLSRFNPQYKLKKLPATPVATMEVARKAAMAAGLHYVYLGNLPTEDGATTFCPGCHKAIVERKFGYRVTAVRIKDGTCEFCGREIAGVWE